MLQRGDNIKRLLILFIIIAVLVSPSHAETPTISGYFYPSGYYGESAGTYTWVNYCPLCYRYGTLEINPKGVREREITCLRCDADYDGTSGADKWYNGCRAYLIPYDPEPEPVVVQAIDKKTELINQFKVFQANTP